MDDIAYLISVQPVLVTIILIGVCVYLFCWIFDFFMSAFCSRWHSPLGFQKRDRGVHQK